MLAVLLATTCFGGVAHATDATWTGTTDGEWTDGTNWSSNPAVPDGTATFDNTASTTSIFNNGGFVSINTMAFTGTAPAFDFSINNAFILAGSGVQNASANTQTFNVFDTLVFSNSSTVTGNVAINNSGFVIAQNTSSTGSATIINNDILEYFDSASSGSGSITNNVVMDFFNSANAGSSSITNSAGGTLAFAINASAQTASIVNNGGTVQFSGSATAAGATIDNLGAMMFTDSAGAGSAAIHNESGATLGFDTSASAGSANITNDGALTFADLSTAATATIQTDGTIDFFNSASAGSANISEFNSPGDITFHDTSSAGNATIHIGGANQPNLIFLDNSGAGTATITLNSGGGLAEVVEFHNSASAESASFSLGVGGNLDFYDTSSGGQARVVITDGSSNVDISSLSNAGTTLGSVEGPGTIALGSKQLTVGSNDLSTLFSGVITDGGIAGGAGGSLVKVGTGTFTLTGANTYTGGTTISAGALQLGDGVSNGTVVGDILDNATLNFDVAGTSSFGGGTISGSGNVNILAGTLVLSGLHTYTGTTTVNAGATLRLGDGLGTAGLLAGPITDNGSIVFDAGVGTFVIYATGITGTGNATLASGTLVLQGTNTYTGTTTINGGATLQLGAGGTTGTVAGNITDNGALKFNYSGPVTYDGTISGSGNVEIVAGTLIATKFQSLVGGTVTIDSGATLQWGNGHAGLLAGGGNAVIDNGALVMNFGGDGVGGNVPISGTGAVTIQSGSFSDSGTSTYTGATTINTNTFFLLLGSGSISNSSGVADNGTFDISGTAAGTSIVNLTGTGKVSLGAQTLTLTNAAGTFSGVLADGGIVNNVPGGGLTIAGGSETLAGTNTYTGTTTINGGATLQLGAGGTTGTVAGNITDNGALKFNYSGPVTIGGTITGSGSVEIVAGTLIETSSSFVGGSVTIDSGATLQWGNGNAAFLTGTANQVVDNGALVMNFGSSGVGGNTPITGTGTVTIQSGSFSDSGTSTYTGATTINTSASLILLGTGSISNSSGVADNGTFDISGTTAGTSIVNLTGTGKVSLGAQTLTLTNESGTFSGVISDGGILGGTGGGLTVAGGTLTLTGANTYTGTTTVNAGATLRAGAANTFSAASGVNVGGTLDLNSFNQTIGSLGGAGNVTLGSATLTTNGNNANSTLFGAISGSGGLTKTGTGVLGLSGVNTYTGPTTINAGTLLMGVANGLSASTDVTVASGALFDLGGFNQTIGSLAGAGTVFLGSATLTTNGDNATTTFSGAINGLGGLTKTGTGTLFLTGASLYTGPTLVNAGVLSVNGTLASAVTVNPGGTLKGTGTVGGVSIGNGAIIAPGNSIGTLHVAGPVSFGVGSTYQVEANAAGQSDLIAATGAATLSGGVVQVLAAAGSYAPSTVYPILTASSVTGTFASVTSNSVLLFPSLSYKPGEVDLTLRTAASFAQTPNQAAVGNAIQSVPASALASAIGALAPAQIPAAFDALSGEIHASMRSQALSDGETVREAVLGRMRDTSGNTGLGVWIHVFNSWDKLGGNTNAAALGGNLSGILVGADSDIGDDIRLGVDAGYTHTTATVNARGSALTANGTHAGVYGAMRSGDFSFGVAAQGAWGTAATTRDVQFPGFADSDSAHQDARTLQAVAEAGYHASLGGIALDPFANVGWISVNNGAFTETGGVSALSGAERESDVTFSNLGLRAGTDFVSGGGLHIMPNASVAWQHGFGGLTPARALVFQSIAQGFTVTGVPLDPDEAVVTANFVAQVDSTATFTAGYQGAFSQHTQNNGVHVGFDWRF